MQKISKKLKKYGCKALSVLAGATLAAAILPAGTTVLAADDANDDMKSFTVNQEDTLDSLKEDYIGTKGTDQDINIDDSKIEAEGLDQNKTGIQNVTLKVSLAKNDGTENTVGYDYTENVLVNVQKSDTPVIELKSDEITLDHGAEWNASDYIEETYTALGGLPALRESDNVNTETDGTYTASYTVIDEYGATTTKELKVTVRMSEEQIVAQKAAEEAAAKAQALAEAQAEAQAAAAAANTSAAVIVSYGTYGSNPYTGGWSNCAYGAWQAVHDYLGISLPAWGSASTWIGSAAASGYATGTTPTVGSIVVYSHHVAYVSQVSGNQIYIIEGGFNGGQNARWITANAALPDQQAFLGYIYVA